MAESSTVYRGEWWLPTEPNDKQMGSLIIESDGQCRLELIGGFQTDEHVPDPAKPGVVHIRSKDGWPLIHGQSGGKAFNLMDCRTISVKDTFFSQSREHNISAARVLRGPLWLGDPAEIAFNGVRLEIDCLLPWSRMTTLSSTVTHEEGTNKYTFQAQTLPMEERSAKFRAMNFKLTQFLGPFQFGWNNPNQRNLVAYEKMYLDVDTRIRHTMEHFEQAAKALQDLLTLCMGRACAVRSTTYAVPLPRERRKNVRNLQPRYNGETYGRQIVVPNELPYKDSIWEALLTLEAIPFDEIIPVWFKLYEKAAIPIQMLVGARYLTSGFLQTRLMTVCSALEALHRSLYDHDLMTKDEHKLFVKQAKEGVQGVGKVAILGVSSGDAPVSV